MPEHEAVTWRARTRIEVRPGDWTGDDIDAGRAPAPAEVHEEEGNLLVYGGASALWERLIGTGVTAFDNTNAHIAVGDSSTAAAATQTDLQAATNKLRKAMDSTYPQHTDGTALANASIVFRATFGSSEANWTWREWSIHNAASGGRMLNRKVISDLIKSSGSSWTIAVTVTLA